MGQSDSAARNLDAWVSETAPRALGYAWTLVHDRQIAEDLVQDCYCRILAKKAVYDLPRDGAKLLYRSITNAAINWTRRQSAELSLDDQQQSGSSDLKAFRDPGALEPVQVVMQRELERAVAAAMNELSLEQRAAIELRSLGHSLGDVAEILEVSHGNARVLLHRARAALAERLNPFLEENST